MRATAEVEGGGVAVLVPADHGGDRGAGAERCPAGAGDRSAGGGVDEDPRWGDQALGEVDDDSVVAVLESGRHVVAAGSWLGAVGVRLEPAMAADLDAVDLYGATGEHCHLDGSGAGRCGRGEGGPKFDVRPWPAWGVDGQPLGAQVTVDVTDHGEVGA